VPAVCYNLGGGLFIDLFHGTAAQYVTILCCAD